LKFVADCDVFQRPDGLVKQIVCLRMRHRVADDEFLFVVVHQIFVVSGWVQKLGNVNHIRMIFLFVDYSRSRLDANRID